MITDSTEAADVTNLANGSLQVGTRLARTSGSSISISISIITVVVVVVVVVVIVVEVVAS